MYMDESLLGEATARNTTRGGGREERQTETENVRGALLSGMHQWHHGQRDSETETGGDTGTRDNNET